MRRMRPWTRFPLLALMTFALGAGPRVADPRDPTGSGDLRDFPHPAGLIRASYSENKRTDRVQEIANYHAEADIDALLADYRKELIAAGWKQGAASDSGTGVHRVVMIDWKKTGREAELRLYPARKGGTDVYVRVNTDPAAAKAPAAAAEVAPAADSAVQVVPSVVGKPAKAAEWSLRGAGFTVSWNQPRIQPAGPGDHADRVAAQDPAAGQRVARGSAIALTATQYMARVPNVIGLTGPRAEERLRSQGLRSQTGPDQASTDRTKTGTVAASSPAAGEQARPDSTVVITLWNLAGPVPNVVGKTVAAAAAALEGPPGGPRFTVTRMPPQAITAAGQAAGLVAVQEPAAGTVALSGSAVRLTAWDRNVRAPNLVGQRYTAPGTQLGRGAPGEHFDIKLGPTKPTTNYRQANTVAEQSPAAGQPIVNGGEITISVYTLAGPVPNVVGKTFLDAAQALGGGPGGTAKFVAQPARGAPTRNRKDSYLIVSQSPAAGMIALDGSTVVLTRPALEQKLPSLVGGTLSQAQRELDQMNLQTQFGTPRPTNDPAQDGRVAAQTPAAGVHVNEGDTVTLTAYSLHPTE